MKNNITELVFILDRSGSMAGLESDTIGGFNAMLTKQKSEDGVAYVTTATVFAVDGFRLDWTYRLPRSTGVLCSSS